MKISVVVDEASVPPAAHMAEADTPDSKLLSETLVELAGPVSEEVADGNVRPQLVADKEV